MDHYSLARKIRGQINLKMCIGLGAIALAGAFIVKLPAQDQPTGASQAALAYLPPFPLNETARGISLKGKIEGAFADSGNDKKILTDTLDFDDANGIGSARLKFDIVPDAVYDVDLTIESDKTDLYGVTIGNPAHNGQSLTVTLAKPAKTIRLQGSIEGQKLDAETVTLAKPAKTIRLQGSIEGQKLDAEAVPWKVLRHAVAIQKDAGATNPAQSGQTTMYGVKRGHFVSLEGDNQDVYKAIPLDAEVPFGLLAVDYQCDALFEAKVAQCGPRHPRKTANATPFLKPKALPCQASVLDYAKKDQNCLIKT